jgi:hypothetical protein
MLLDCLAVGIYWTDLTSLFLRPMLHKPPRRSQALPYLAWKCIMRRRSTLPLLYGWKHFRALIARLKPWPSLSPLESVERISIHSNIFVGSTLIAAWSPWAELGSYIVRAVCCCGESHANLCRRRKMFIGGLNWETTDRKLHQKSRRAIVDLTTFLRVSQRLLFAIW